MTKRKFKAGDPVFLKKNQEWSGHIAGDTGVVESTEYGDTLVVMDAVRSIPSIKWYFHTSMLDHMINLNIPILGDDDEDCI